LFELSLCARKAAKDVDLSYKTTLKSFDILRRVLVEDLARSDALLKGELEDDGSYFGGRRKGKGGRVQVIRPLYSESWNGGEKYQSVS